MYVHIFNYDQLDNSELHIFQSYIKTSTFLETQSL